MLGSLMEKKMDTTIMENQMENEMETGIILGCIKIGTVIRFQIDQGSWTASTSPEVSSPWPSHEQQSPFLSYSHGTICIFHLLHSQGFRNKFLLIWDNTSRRIP